MPFKWTIRSKVSFVPFPSNAEVTNGKLAIANNKISDILCNLWNLQSVWIFFFFLWEGGIGDIYRNVCNQTKCQLSGLSNRKSLSHQFQPALFLNSFLGENKLRVTVQRELCVKGGEMCWEHSVMSQLYDTAMKGDYVIFPTNCPLWY